MGLKRFKGINDRLEDMSDDELIERLILIENVYEDLYAMIHDIDFNTYIKTAEDVSLQIVKAKKEEMPHSLIKEAQSDLDDILRKILMPKALISEFIVAYTQNLSQLISYKEEILVEGKSRNMRYNGGILTKAGY